jgi:hypothetical protein
LAQAGELFFLSDPSGLSAEAEFTLLNPTTLEVRLRNTSTDVPDDFDEADQLLTGVSWDFGAPGVNAADVDIIGGSVKSGPTSFSINFSVSNVGSNADVSGEYGYGNDDGTGALPNFVSGNTAQATPFGGPNLDGPDNIDGPQGGLAASPPLVALNGLGAISNEIIATLTLSEPITAQQLADDLHNNLVRVEFGSDAAFLITPEPHSALVLVLGAALANRRRRAA